MSKRSQRCFISRCQSAVCARLDDDERQQLRALRTHWQHCKLTQNGRKPSVAPQSATKHVAKKIHRTPSKRRTKTTEFATKSHLCQKTTPLIHARCFMFVKLNRDTKGVGNTLNSHWIWELIPGSLVSLSISTEVSVIFMVCSLPLLGGIGC